jgi:folate-dependent phosphoribosylglycinamide formyltransferase PurN
MGKKIVLLAGTWDTTAIVYNYLSQHFTVEKVIREEPVPRKTFLKKRIKKLGWITVSGQVLFQLLIGKPLAAKSKKRRAEILNEYGLSDKNIPADQLIDVSSVNSPEALAALEQIQPELIIVHGTRIISKKVLQATGAQFINIHAGITPRYRGSHGAYWALTKGDHEHCGVTVHLVDAGIDTGNILAQGPIPLTKEDNFATYPYLQLAEGLKLMKPVVDALLRNEPLRPLQNDLDSGLWHHPTLWGYLLQRIKKGVR